MDHNARRMAAAQMRILRTVMMNGQPPPLEDIFPIAVYNPSLALWVARQLSRAGNGNIDQAINILKECLNNRRAYRYPVTSPEQVIAVFDCEIELWTLEEKKLDAIEGKLGQDKDANGQAEEQKATEDADSNAQDDEVIENSKES